MPAKSKSQQRLFGMVHAYQKGELKNVSKNIEEIAAHISEEDAEHFAKTKHKKLPEKKAEAHHPDFKDIVQAYKDRFGIDLSHVKMKWSKHPRYSNGKVDKDMPDDMSGGCHGPGTVWMNPNPRAVMKRYGVDGKVKDFRRWIIAHELAHEIDSALNKRKFVDKILEEAKKVNYHSSYLDTVPERKFDKELFAEYMAKKLSEPAEKKAERLYTYLPKNNTALTDGLLSTALSPNGWEKYKGRTGKSSRDSVLKVLDSWEPEWTRSKAVSALPEPIPEDAAEDFLEFARNRKLYSFDTKDLIKAKILTHLRLARNGGGSDPADDVKPLKLNWNRKKKHLLFQGVPHYFVETKDGKIPPELIRKEKKANIQGEYDMTYISKIAAAAVAALAAAPTTPAAAAARPVAKPQARPVVRTVAKPAATPVPVVKTPAKPAPVKPAPVKPVKSIKHVKPTITNPTAKATDPVGFRQNNAFNVKSDGKTFWYGSTGVPAKGEFVSFNDPYSGIRAGARVIYNHGKLHNVNTIRDLIGIYAPESDNNKNNKNYISSVSKKTGLGPDQEIDLTDEKVLLPVAQAMGEFEVGPSYWSIYDPTSITNAIKGAFTSIKTK